MNEPIPPVHPGASHAELRAQAAELRLHGLLAHWDELMGQPESEHRVDELCGQVSVHVPGEADVHAQQEHRGQGQAARAEYQRSVNGVTRAAVDLVERLEEPGGRQRHDCARDQQRVA